ncbi:hypothetical protein [Blastopirellula marina]|uniref:Transmembrane protein n=1 Tax=Blastopirellula marina DSM 3645 TaxID=314230 RepID=A3ZTV7_9BACT|nr:hypothetical protein [Blastopirellula marina]EAQ80014.1 hypothetical protein DSM3645_05310 [Blastopirellula marina DSM 3645]
MNKQKNSEAIKTVHFLRLDDSALGDPGELQPNDNPYSSPSHPLMKNCEDTGDVASPPRVVRQIGKDLLIAAVIAIVGTCIALYLASYQHQSVSTFVLGYLAGTLVSFLIVLHRIWSAVMKQKWGIGG